VAIFRLSAPEKCHEITESEESSMLFPARKARFREWKIRLCKKTQTAAGLFEKKDAWISLH
jgi:hypothetical protein